MILKRGLPTFIALTFGLLTLIGLLFLPALSGLILGWATLLAGIALLIGVVNLFFVHAARFFRGNGYSGLLVLSMLALFGLAVSDAWGVTEEGVLTAFNWIQVPLEAALASLLAFFLLFAGFRLLYRQPTGWSFLFILTVILVMLANTPLPAQLGDWFGWIGDVIARIFVDAGMRGILIGVALGTITISLRLLVGLERPYNK